MTWRAIPCCPGLVAEPACNPAEPTGVPSPVLEQTEARIQDRRLVAAFRAGDVDAFEQIVRIHRRRMFVIALRKVGSVEVAEDAVQVALSKAYRHLGTLGDDVDLGAWLATVVQNAALDQIRSDTRQQRLAERAHAAAPARAAGVTFAEGLDRLEREELGKVLGEALQALPEPYRRALELYHVQGLPVEEVGAVLALNVNTVKSHLARGRGILRRKLHGQLRQGEYL